MVAAIGSQVAAECLHENFLGFDLATNET